MLIYYLKLYVICVLLASLEEVSTDAGFHLPFQVRFDIFMKSLGDGICAGAAEFDTTLKFDSLDQIRILSEEFKKYCIWAFEKRLKLGKIGYFDENKALLGKFAFAALDSACKEAVKSLKVVLTNDVEYTKELELILYKGDILDFLDFMENPGIPTENMENEITRLQDKNAAMKRIEAVVRIILHKYNVGKILKNYPKPDNCMDRMLKLFCCLILGESNEPVSFLKDKTIYSNQVLSNK